MGVIRKLLGSKSTRDIKAIDPIIKAIKAAEGEIAKLSHDQLRGKTAEFKERIVSYIKEEETEVQELKASIEGEDNILEREKMWEQVDKLEKTIYEKTQNILNEILPEAFAVMKETAKRFTENEKCWI